MMAYEYVGKVEEDEEKQCSGLEALQKEADEDYDDEDEYEEDEDEDYDEDEDDEEDEEEDYEEAVSNEEESEEDRLLFHKEQQCLLLVLEARKFLASIVAFREKQDRDAWDERNKADSLAKMTTGRLSIQEIQVFSLSLSSIYEVNLTY